MQWLNVFIGSLGILPARLAMDLLRYFRTPSVRSLHEELINNVTDVIAKVREAFPWDEVMLTGHSLGGGWASIAAAQVGRPAVVFSAPGGKFQAMRYGMDRSSEYRNIVSVMPDSDPEPRVDVHNDMSQHIVCQGPDGEPRQPATKCHLMKVTICELWRVCGDSEGRDLQTSCVGDLGLVNHKCIGKGFGDGRCPGLNSVGAPEWRLRGSSP